MSEKLGKFDITLFLGVVYHLKYPLLALERLAEVTKGTLVVESAIIPSQRLAPGVQSYGGLAHELRFIENIAGVEAVQNWFIPSLNCLKAFLRVTDFGEIVRESVEGERALVIAQRGDH